jgi:cytochrome c-type biogenesis protein CcmE
MNRSSAKIALACAIILGTVGWLAWTGVAANKDYYVTIGEMHQMGAKAYTRHLRVGGFVVPGSIHRNGPNATFTLTEQTAGDTNPACKNGGPECLITVDYKGDEPPPDTFKDESQALAIGTYGHDGVFHATGLQAKCASKYAPAKPGEAPAKPAAAAAQSTATLVPPTK